MIQKALPAQMVDLLTLPASVLVSISYRPGRPKYTAS
jgi:hypothetical protein